MIFAFSPSSTRRGCLGPTDIFEDGRVVPSNFLFRLSNISLMLDDFSATQNDTLQNDTIRHDELRNVVSRIDDQLQTLAAQAAPGWWTDNGNNSLIDLLLQYFYQYVAMRAQLPLFLQWASSSRPLSNSAACIQACRSLVKGYLKVYHLLPEGYFVHRVLDFQAYTAIVILILANYSVSLSEEDPVSINQSEQENQDSISRVLQAMEYNSKRSGSGLAEDAISSVQALARLLANNDMKSNDEELSFTAPLLGKIQVRSRRQPRSRREELIPESPNTIAQLHTELLFDDNTLHDVDVDLLSSFSWSINEYGGSMYDIIAQCPANDAN